MRLKWKGPGTLLLDNEALTPGSFFEADRAIGAQQLLDQDRAEVEPTEDQLSDLYAVDSDEMEVFYGQESASPEGSQDLFGEPGVPDGGSGRAGEEIQNAESTEGRRKPRKKRKGN